jgi:phosphoribosylformimino-5-aminoimidazole carboxamide ribotide isomerase
MRLYPAIDLKGGACVRLFKGDMQQATTYNTNPAAQAQAFVQEGFRALHIVDLDGAMDGATRNHDAITAIRAACDVPIQLGGGIRTQAAAEGWLAAGVTRIILGTVAMREPALVKHLCAKYPERIMVGIDAKNGMVAVEGWVEDSDISASELAKRFEGAGVAGIIYTDIGRDGTLAGPNIVETAALARATSIPVILSGGIGALADIAAVAREGAAITGIVLGKALYEKRLDPHAALALCPE